MTPPPLVPRPAPRLDYLDGWRGLAILLVLQSHFLPVQAWRSGALGVDVFFVLSGWLMAGLLFVRREPLSRFYKRRISRIVPSFVAFVLVAYALSAAAGERPRVGEVLASLVFLRTYLPPDSHIWSSLAPVGHLWSLNVEEHSYVLMSLLVLLPWARGREHGILIGAGLCGVAVGFFYAHTADRAPSWGRLGTEVAAAPLMLSAGYRLLLERHPLEPAAWIAPLAAPLAALLGGLCYLRAAPWQAQALAAPLLLAVAMNHLAHAGSWLQRFLSMPWLRLCGIYSFSIYLWQQLFFQVRAWLPCGSGVALTLVAMAAWCSYRLIEHPCREALNQRW